jgi:hypothetical protein
VPGDSGRFWAGPEKEEEPEDLSELVGKRLMTSKLIARMVDSLGEGQTFVAAWMARETNRRFHSALKRPVDALPSRPPSAACATPGSSARSNPAERPMRRCTRRGGRGPTA